MSDVDTRSAAERRALRLEWATIAWNLGEVFVTVGLGIAAGSLALVAFGMDSLIEVAASLAVVWRGFDDELHHRTGRAMRVIAVAFFALATALTIGAAQRLITGAVPDESPWGIAYLAVTALVMLGLAVAKSRTARVLSSLTLDAEARVTYLDAALATSILVALALNIAFAWWWADPVAALLVAAVAVREGREAWSEAGDHDADA